MELESKLLNFQDWFLFSLNEVLPASKDICIYHEVPKITVNDCYLLPAHFLISPRSLAQAQLIGKTKLLKFISHQDSLTQFHLLSLGLFSITPLGILPLYIFNGHS